MARRERRDIDYAALVQDFCLMDDEFMTTFFDGQLECTQYVLRTILGRDDLRVTKVQAQKNQGNLYGRSGRLDIVAEDASGRLFNVEVQRADRGAGAKRARFNLGLIDTQTLGKGQDTERLPEVYVVFITEHDVLGAGKGVYHVERMVRETGAEFGDMAHIVYVNGEYRGEDRLGELMHDFSCRRAGEMRSGILAGRAKYLKGNEQEVRRMSYAVEELIKQQRQEERMERDIETAAGLLADGLVTEEKITAFFHFTPEQMEEVRELVRDEVEDEAKNGRFIS